MRLAERLELVQPSAIRDLPRFGGDHGLISFDGGYPDSGRFAIAELREVFAELLARDASVPQVAPARRIFSATTPSTGRANR
jgi:hypothetical protein